MKRPASASTEPLDESDSNEYEEEGIEYFEDQAVGNRSGPAQVWNQTRKGIHGRRTIPFCV